MILRGSSVTGTTSSSSRGLRGYHARKAHPVLEQVYLSSLLECSASDAVHNARAQQACLTSRPPTTDSLRSVTEDKREQGGVQAPTTSPYNHSLGEGLAGKTQHLNIVQLLSEVTQETFHSGRGVLQRNAMRPGALTNCRLANSIWTSFTATRRMHMIRAASVFASGCLRCNSQLSSPQICMIEGIDVIRPCVASKRCLTLGEMTEATHTQTFACRFPRLRHILRLTCMFYWLESATMTRLNPAPRYCLNSIQARYGSPRSDLSTWSLKLRGDEG